MSMIPSDLTAHVGQEVSLRDVFRAAWRSHRRNFWKGLLCLFVTLLVVAAIQAAGIGLQVIGAMLNNYPPTVLVIVIGIAGWVTMVLVPAFVHTPLGGGLLWSMSRTFDGQPLSLGGLFAGFRRRYLRLMWLGLLEFVALAVVWGVPVLLMVLSVYTVSLGGRGNYWDLVLPVLAAFLLFPPVLLLVHAFFYLAPLFAMADDKVGAWTCLRYNLRVMRARPKQFAKVFLFPLLGWVPLFFGVLVFYVALMWVGTSMARLGNDLSETPKESHVLAWLAVVGGVLVLVGFVLWWGLLTGMLKTAFFRAAYGYSLDQPFTMPATLANGATAAPAESTRPVL